MAGRQWKDRSRGKQRGWRTMTRGGSSELQRGGVQNQTVLPKAPTLLLPQPPSGAPGAFPGEPAAANPRPEGAGRRLRSTNPLTPPSGGGFEGTAGRKRPRLPAPPSRARTSAAARRGDRRWAAALRGPVRARRLGVETPGLVSAPRAPETEPQAGHHPARSYWSYW